MILMLSPLAEFCRNQVARIKFFVMGFRGDWKSFVQIFNLNRHAGTDEVGVPQNLQINTC